MDKDIVQDARERFKEAKEKDREQTDRMLEELRFSNSADFQQWPESIRKMRENAEGGARPCLTFDQTNQYIQQVVNESRQNKPSIQVRPVDSKADIKVADALSGLFRHIEDVSRADIAYDTAIEHAARCGRGWLRVNTQIIDPSINQQEIIIQRIADPLSAWLDPDYQEPDGSDAMDGGIEAMIGRRAFSRQYPDADSMAGKSDPDGWCDKDGVRVLEYFKVREDKTHFLVFDDPANPGEEVTLSEDKYWEAVKEIGFKPPLIREYWAKKRTCQWYKITGEEVLEETKFPAGYVPLIPVIGSELWIEGKRYLSGLVRPMMDPARAYNYDRSNYIEHVSLQTKIPYLAAAEAVEGYENEWRNANRSNSAYLPWNALDSDGTPLPKPERAQGPVASAAYAQGSQMAQNDIQASIGMYRANLGAPSNETSGKAINERKMQGETANFHYSDNMSRSVRHLGRIIMEMLPNVIDTKRELRILGEDGQASTVTLDPEQSQSAIYKNPDKKSNLISFNPNVGRYDVSIQVGPAFGTRRQEAVEALQQVIGGNPQMMALLGDEFVKMMDIPGAEKIAKRMQSMLPPEAREQEGEDGDGPSPEVQQVMQQAQQAIQQKDMEAQQMLQQMQQMAEQLQKMQQAIEDKAADRDADIQKEQIKADAQVACEQIKAGAQQQAGQETAAHEQGESDQAMMAVVEVTNSVKALAEQLAQQNMHIFQAVAEVADAVFQPTDGGSPSVPAEVYQDEP